LLLYIGYLPLRILKILINLKRIERWPYNKEMDIAYLLKQANNHEQPLKRENSTQKKRETRPSRQNPATGKKYLYNY
jgi:hypothetical protein